MKHQKNSEELIKKYIAEVLKDSKKPIVEYIAMDDSGMGGAYGSQSDLFNTFIKPFTDVVGTVVGKTKEVARRGMTLLNVAFETLMTTLVPFLTDSYDEIFAKEKTDLAKIRSEYQPYYDATAKALGGTDAKMLAFMAFPGAALTGKFVKDAPKAAKGILSVASGGITDKYLGGSGATSGGGGKKGPGDIFDSYVRAYNQLLSEDEKKEDSEDSSLAAKIGSKKFIDAVMDKSPTFKAAEKEARQLHMQMLGERIKPIFDILDAESIEDLGKVLKKPLQQPDLKGVDPQQKLSAQEAEKKFLEGAKKTAIKAALDAIKKYVQPARLAFGDDHPFVKSYDDVLSAIESGKPELLDQIKKQTGISQ